MELHAHTKETSPCGTVFADELIKAYKEKGYDGVVITDHFGKGLFTFSSERENIDAFLKGYRIAKDTGDKIGVKVLLGAEIKLTENAHNEYLMYGIDEDFLYKNPDLFEKSLKEVKKIVNDYGALLIQAHPLRNGVCMPSQEVDGYEVFNGHYSHNNYNDKAVMLTEGNDKFSTSGSDSHWIYDIGNGGIEVEKIPEQHELAELIRSKPALIKTKMQHLKVAIIEGNKAFNQELPSDLDAIVCLGKVKKPISDALVFFDCDGPFCSYFEENRYFITSQKEPDFKFDPSLCINGESGTSFITIGENATIDRIDSKFRITVQKNSVSIVEFFGYKPIIRQVFEI